jgi:hypothetical protein
LVKLSKLPASLGEMVKTAETLALGSADLEGGALTQGGTAASASSASDSKTSSPTNTAAAAAAVGTVMRHHGAAAVSGAGMAVEAVESDFAKSLA